MSGGVGDAGVASWEVAALLQSNDMFNMNTA